MKFLDIKTDYAFKKVFGVEENKDILIEFLNSIVDFPQDNQIKDLKIVDPYNIPMLKGMKDTYVDVKAVLEDGSKVIIEMQVLNHEGFEKRVLYNMAKNYSAQLIQGESYSLLNPIIAITIADFTMFNDTDKIVTYFKLLEKTEFIDYSNDIEMIFVELPKFNKTLQELKTIQDKYIYFIKNAGSLECIPKELNTLQKAFGIINEANLSQEELEIQYKRKEFISIQKLALKKALNDGMKKGLREGLKEGLQKGIEQGVKQGIEQGVKQGIEQGIEKGKKEAKVEIAKQLLDVLDDETIAIKTGLSVDEICALR